MTHLSYYLILLEAKAWDRSHWCQQDAFLPEALGENLSPCLFQFLETVCVPWLMACFFIFKASRIASPIFLWLWFFCSLLSHLRIYVIYWAHSNNLGCSPCFKVSWSTTLIPPVTIILLCHVLERIHCFWGLRHGYIWETVIHFTTHYFLQSWEAFSKYLFFEYFWILKCFLSWTHGF